MVTDGKAPKTSPCNKIASPFCRSVSHFPSIQSEKRIAQKGLYKKLEQNKKKGLYEFLNSILEIKNYINLFLLFPGNHF
jgi:hypothetical protein